MSRLFEGLLHVPPALVLTLVFLLPALEASAFVGIVFPGEIAVLLGGVVANQGKVALWLVIVLGFLGAATGDTIGYEVGRRYGRTLLSKLPARLVKAEHIDRGEQLLREKGGRAVFIGRFTATLRALIPGLAGMSRLPYRRFLAFNVAGAASWVSVVAVSGFVVGRSYRSVEHRFGLISVGLLVAIVGWLLCRLLSRSLRVRSFTEAHFPWAHTLDASLLRTALVLFGAVWLFAGLAQDATAHDGVALSDQVLLNDVTGLRQGWLTPIAVAISASAGAVLYTFLVAAGLLYWRSRRNWQVPLLAVLVLAIGQLVRLGLNTAFAVPRPPQSLWLSDAVGDAFPSGHTTSATIGYGLIAFLLVRADPPRRSVYIGAAVIIAISAGLSRLYLGVHWPSDVLGGWTLGVAWLALASIVTQATTYGRRSRRSPDPRLTARTSKQPVRFKPPG